MKKIIALICVFFLNTAYLIPAQADVNKKDPVSFGTGGHVMLGREVCVKSIDGKCQYNPTIEMPNGLSLTYAQILAMPDYFGTAKTPISDGKNEEVRESRFQAAFNTLASNENAINEAHKLVKTMLYEVNAVEEAKKQGIEPSEVYKKIGTKLTLEYTADTAGYMELLAWRNWDHFQMRAWKVYEAGHSVAINEAILASKTTNSEQQKSLLNLAYAEEAFSEHYLTDLFASGHMRAPRKELYTHYSAVGNLLSMLMHDEDCKYGVVVTNSMGEEWHVYGDQRYLDTVDNENRMIIKRVVQLSANEIYSAFANGYKPTVYQAKNWIPNIDQLYQYKTDKLNNYRPLLYWNPQNNIFYYRKDFKHMTHDGQMVELGSSVRDALWLLLQLEWSKYVGRDIFLQEFNAYNLILINLLSTTEKDYLHYNNIAKLA